MEEKKEVKFGKKKITQQGIVLLGAIVGLFIIVFILFLTIPSTDAFDFTVRLFALWGYLAIAIATLMTPFLKEIYKNFGRPFIKIHHLFAAIGLACATLHPVLFAIEMSNWRVFIPDFSSWYNFWRLGGRPALILLYVAIIGVLIRKNIKKYWRAIHALMYVVLLLGFVHGVIIGTDFANIGIMIIFSIIFASSVLAFIYKRYLMIKSKKKK